MPEAFFGYPPTSPTYFYSHSVRTMLHTIIARVAIFPLLHIPSKSLQILAKVAIRSGGALDVNSLPGDPAELVNGIYNS